MDEDGNSDLENIDYGFKSDSWYAIIWSAFGWFISYQLLTVLLPSKSREYCCRIVSFWHGVLSAFIGINECFAIDTSFDELEWRTTNSQKFLLVCSLGYFIYDLGWCLLFQRDSKLMLAHHIYSVFALYRMLFKSHSGAQAACALGSMELTNPMLQIRWFLRSEGFYPSLLYTSVEITFMLIFFFVRILIGTYMLSGIIFQPKNDLEFKILSSSIYIMSWMFMINIWKYMLIKYGGFSGKVDEKS